MARRSPEKAPPPKPAGPDIRVVMREVVDLVYGRSEDASVVVTVKLVDLMKYAASRGWQAHCATPYRGEVHWRCHILTGRIGWPSEQCIDPVDGMAICVWRADKDEKQYEAQKAEGLKAREGKVNVLRTV